MAGSRERLLYDRRSDYDADYRRYEPYQDPHRYRERRPERDSRERPRRKNGYVYEDIYSDFDEAQGKLSLFRPIRPEFLHLPSSYDIKYNSLPRNYYNYERDSDRDRRRKKDYYDFRIENERKRDDYEYRSRERPKPNLKPLQSQLKPLQDRTVKADPNSKPKNVAVCKPLRISEKTARYWTSDIPERSRSRPKKAEEKKIVKFSEVSGCNRQMVVDDPIFGRKVVPVRELEVSLDQMIQNGYFEKHNIPIRPMVRAETIVKEVVKEKEIVQSEQNGKCLTGSGKVQPQRRTRHLPQVSLCLLLYRDISITGFNDQTMQNS